MPPSQPVQIATFAAAVLATLAAPILGGWLNRLRGGCCTYWPHIPPSFNEPDGGNVITHDGPQRLIMSGGTGLAVAVAVGRAGKGSLVVLLFVVATFFSFLVGWGSYFSMGRSNEYKGRVGAFDWLVGNPAEDWDFDRLYTRDMVALSLRGALETIPTGLLLLLLGFGYLPLISGLFMGPIYDIAFRIPSTLLDYSQGTALGELTWGIWIWITLLTTVLVHNARGRYTWSPLWRPCCAHRNQHSSSSSSSAPATIERVAEGGDGSNSCGFFSCCCCCSCPPGVCSLASEDDRSSEGMAAREGALGRRSTAASALAPIRTPSWVENEHFAHTVALASPGATHGFLVRPNEVAPAATFAHHLEGAGAYGNDEAWSMGAAGEFGSSPLGIWNPNAHPVSHQPFFPTTSATSAPNGRGAGLRFDDAASSSSLTAGSAVAGSGAGSGSGSATAGGVGAGAGARSSVHMDGASSINARRTIGRLRSSNSDLGDPTVASCGAAVWDCTGQCLSRTQLCCSRVLLACFLDGRCPTAEEFGCGDGSSSSSSSSSSSPSGRPTGGPFSAASTTSGGPGLSAEQGNGDGPFGSGSHPDGASEERCGWLMRILCLTCCCDEAPRWCRRVRRCFCDGSGACDGCGGRADAAVPVLHLNRGASCVLHTYLLFFEILFLLSCLSYGTVEQSDMRNRDQTLIGLITQTVAIVILHFILLVRQLHQWRLDRRRRRALRAQRARNELRPVSLWLERHAPNSTTSISSDQDSTGRSPILQPASHTLGLLTVAHAPLDASPLAASRPLLGARALLHAEVDDTDWAAPYGRRSGGRRGPRALSAGSDDRDFYPGFYGGWDAAGDAGPEDGVGTGDGRDGEGDGLELLGVDGWRAALDPARVEFYYGLGTDSDVTRSQRSEDRTDRHSRARRAASGSASAGTGVEDVHALLLTNSPSNSTVGWSPRVSAPGRTEAIGADRSGTTTQARGENVGERGRGRPEGPASVAVRAPGRHPSVDDPSPELPPPDANSPGLGLMVRGRSTGYTGPSAPIRIPQSTDRGRASGVPGFGAGLGLGRAPPGRGADRYEAPVLDEAAYHDDPMVTQSTAPIDVPVGLRAVDLGRRDRAADRAVKPTKTARDAQAASARRATRTDARREREFRRQQREERRQLRARRPDLPGVGVGADDTDEDDTDEDDGDEDDSDVDGDDGAGSDGSDSDSDFGSDARGADTRNALPWSYVAPSALGTGPVAGPFGRPPLPADVVARPSSDGAVGPVPGRRGAPATNPAPRVRAAPEPPNDVSSRRADWARCRACVQVLVFEAPWARICTRRSAPGLYDVELQLRVESSSEPDPDGATGLCCRRFLLLRPTARNAFGVHGVMYTLFTIAMLAWHVGWFIMLFDVVVHNPHPWGRWPGSSG